MILNKNNAHGLTEKWVKVSEAVLHTSMSNQEHVVQEMHDILESYYKVARKRVVDVIVMQAVMYHLLSGPESPLKVLSPELVSSLTPEQLELIAGENAGTKKKRVMLQKMIGDLEQGKKILASSYAI